MLKKVALYELFRIIRSKTYIFSLIFVPLLAILPFIFIVLSSYQEQNIKKGSDNDKIYVVDEINLLKQSEAIKQYTIFYWGVENQERRVLSRVMTVEKISSKEEGIELVKDKKISEFIILNNGYKGKDKKIPLYTINRNIIGLTISQYQRYDSFFTNMSAYDLNLDEQELKYIIKHPIYKPKIINDINNTNSKKLSDTDIQLQVVVPVLLILVFFMAVATSYDAILLSVTREKRNKLIEILLATLPAETLLLGKVIGVLSAALLKMFIWGSAFIIIPYIGAQIFTDSISYDIPLLTVLYVILFTGAGILLYGSICAGIAFIIDSEQGAKFPVIGLAMISGFPATFLPYMIKHPNDWLSLLLSHFPFFSPIGMPVRLAVTGSIAFYEIFISLTLLFITIHYTIKFSSRLLRISLAKQGEKVNITGFIKAFLTYK